MSVSPVQSSSKCGSDFSIERILGEETKGPAERLQTPSWLCCTRYQPPRVPRSGSVSRARRSGRHARVPFTSAQATALETAYARAPYLAPPALRALAAALQLREDRIKIWFQNRRARERREKSGPITSPQAITLPSTAVIQKFDRNETWAMAIPNIAKYDRTKCSVRPLNIKTLKCETSTSQCNFRPISSENVQAEIFTNPFSNIPSSIRNVKAETSISYSWRSSSPDEHSSDRSESPLDVETLD